MKAAMVVALIALVTGLGTASSSQFPVSSSPRLPAPSSKLGTSESWALGTGNWKLSQDEVTPCDLAKVEDGFWCLRCRQARRAPELDKDGACAACGLAPEKTKLCFKSWVPKCGMHEMGPHDKPCCTSPTCCRIEVLGAPVNFRCAGCGAQAASESKILHRKAGHRTEIQQVCSRSGRFPHGGALPEKKKPEDEPKEKDK